MAITALPYGAFLSDLGSGVHNFTSDTDKVALLTSSYVADYDAHVSYADVSGFEVTGGGYTAGGATLSSKTWTYDAGTNTATLGAGPVTWTDLAVTARYVVVYRVGTSAANSRLIGLLDFGQDRVYDVEPLQLSFPTGVVSIAAI